MESEREGRSEEKERMERKHERKRKQESRDTLTAEEGKKGSVRTARWS